MSDKITTTVRQGKRGMFHAWVSVDGDLTDITCGHNHKTAHMAQACCGNLANTYQHYWDKATAIYQIDEEIWGVVSTPPFSQRVVTFRFAYITEED